MAEVSLGRDRRGASWAVKWRRSDVAFDHRVDPYLVHVAFDPENHQGSADNA